VAKGERPQSTRPRHEPTHRQRRRAPSSGFEQRGNVLRNDARLAGAQRADEPSGAVEPKPDLLPAEGRLEEFEDVAGLGHDVVAGRETNGDVGDNR
jgi:hypothetical protein